MSVTRVRCARRVTSRRTSAASDSARAYCFSPSDGVSGEARQLPFHASALGAPVHDGHPVRIDSENDNGRHAGMDDQVPTTVPDPVTRRSRR
jgi:hypothetical protein